MTNSVIEIAEIKLAKGKTEADLVKAAERLRAEFLFKQRGFLTHDLVRRADDAYSDIVRWESMADAEAAMKNAETSPVCGVYFSHMDIDPDDLHGGVSHVTVLSSGSLK